MMKKPLLLLLAVAASGSALAVDIGRVISSTPVIQQVAVPKQVCSNQEVVIQQPKSGAGAAIGAIAGGALGNAAGGRPSARAAATVIGVLGGAILGDRIEGTPEPELRTVQQCGTQTTYENRTVAYNVVYEFAGKQYSTQLPHDPGPTLALQIGPAGAKNFEDPEPTITVQPVYTQPPIVVAQPYPMYYPRPYYYPPITLDLGFGYWSGGYRGLHHWH